MTCHVLPASVLRAYESRYCAKNVPSGNADSPRLRGPGAVGAGFQAEWARRVRTGRTKRRSRNNAALDFRARSTSAGPSISILTGATTLAAYAASAHGGAPVLAKTPEADRPGLVAFVIVTDGHENSSHELTHPQVKAMIGNEMPMEPELERWFPLWGVPL